MSKKQNQKQPNKQNNEKKKHYSVIKELTKHENKHGQLKGETKKETKNLKAGCVHHDIYKGELRQRSIPNKQTGIAHCTMCGKDYPVVPYSDIDSERIIREYNGMVDQAKHMAIIARADEETVRYLSDLGVRERKFHKTYTKLKNFVIEKDEMNGGKSNKEKNKRGGTRGNYNSWGGSWTYHN